MSLGNLVILSRQELEGIKREAFRGGLARGSFEEAMRQYELSPEFRAYQREAQAEAAAKLRREMKLPPHPTTECANCHRMLQAALLKIGRDT